MATAAKYPAAQLALADVGGDVINNGELDLLTTVISTTLTIVATAAIPAGWPQVGFILVDNEVIKHTSWTGSTFTVPAVAPNGRGFDGTSAAGHTAGAKIKLTDTALRFNQQVAEIIAIETELGLNPRGAAATVSARVAALEGAVAPWVSVKSYAATGDGSTNDLPAFISARDAAGTNGMVYVPAAAVAYQLNGQLPLTLAGQRWLFAGGAKLRLGNTQNVDLIKIAATGIEFWGGDLDGNRTNNLSSGSAISVQAADFTAHLTYIHDTRAKGIEQAADACPRGRILFCRIQDTGGEGGYLNARTGKLHFFATPPDDWLVMGCRITGSGMDNIPAARDGWLVANNVKGTRFIGNLMEETLRTVAITNVVNNGSGLFRVTAASHGQVTGNQIVITGVGGSVGINNSPTVGTYWTVTVINSSTLDLQGSTFAGTYTSGGLVNYGIGGQLLESTDPETWSITGASNATPIRITLVAHGLSNGDVVNISNVSGNTAANGRWYITSITADTFDIYSDAARTIGAVGSGTYTANTGTAGGQSYETLYAFNTLRASTISPGILISMPSGRSRCIANRFIGGGRGSYALEVSGPRNVVSGNQVTDWGGTGIAILCGQQQPATDSKIDGNIIEGSSVRTGAPADGSGKCIAMANQGGAQKAQRVTISNNVLWNGEHIQIELTNDNDTVLRGNEHFHDNIDHASVQTGSTTTNATIAQCKFVYVTGVTAAGSSICIVVGNGTIWITGNRIEGNGVITDGIDANNVAFTEVWADNNVVRGAATRGIRITSTDANRTCFAHNNKVKGATTAYTIGTGVFERDNMVIGTGALSTMRADA